MEGSLTTDYRGNHSGLTRILATMETSGDVSMVADKSRFHERRDRGVVGSNPARSI